MAGMRRSTLAIVVSIFLLTASAGYASGAATDPGPTKAESSASLHDVGLRTLVRLVCRTKMEALVRFVDLDGDGEDEALVSVVCVKTDPDLLTTGIVVEAREGPMLADVLVAPDVRVDDKANPPTLAAFVPTTDAKEQLRLIETIYGFADGSLYSLSERSLPAMEYFESIFAATSDTPEGRLVEPTNSSLLLRRPQYFAVPPGYDGSPTPLLVLLHGYDPLDGSGLESFWHNSVLNGAMARGWLYLRPSGLSDTLNPASHFWNATDACCDKQDRNVDDVSYLRSLIDRISLDYNIDPDRIYVIGYSNGGFMAHRLACDMSDRLAAVISINGAQWLDPAKCTPTSPVSVLEIHSRDDEFVDYDGGGPLKYEEALYPSAHDTFARWGDLNGCSFPLSLVPTIDLVAEIPGSETQREGFLFCGGGAAELWTIDDATHIVDPVLGWPHIFGFLEAHPKG